MLIEAFKTIIFFEWVFFIVFILGIAILLLSIRKASTVDQLIRILLWSQKKLSIAEVKERILKIRAKLVIVKFNIFMSMVIVIISLLGLRYLVIKKYADIALPNEFFLFSILGMIPMPFVVFLLEYYTKKILGKIESLQVLEEIKS